MVLSHWSFKQISNGLLRCYILNFILKYLFIKQLLSRKKNCFTQFICCWVELVEMKTFLRDIVSSDGLCVDFCLCIKYFDQVKWNKPYLSNLPASYNHGKKITLTNFKEAAFISIKTSKLELRKLYMYIVISLIEISLIDVQTLPYLHRLTR